MPEESYEDINEYESEVQDYEEVSSSENDGESSSESEYETDTETDGIDYDLLLQKLIEKTVSGNEIDESETVTAPTETTEEASTEEVELCTDLETFENSTVQVDLYQYTILNRLEFMQYAISIVIALLFLLIFMRYRKK